MHSTQSSGSAPNRPDFPERDKKCPPATALLFDHQNELVLHQLPVQASNFQIHKDYTNMVRLRSYQGRSPDQNFVGSHGHHKYFNFLGTPITVFITSGGNSFGSPPDARNPLFERLVWQLIVLSSSKVQCPGTSFMRNSQGTWPSILEYVP